MIVVAKSLSPSLSSLTRKVAFITLFEDSCNQNIISLKCRVLKATPECRSRRRYGRKTYVQVVKIDDNGGWDVSRF